MYSINALLGSSEEGMLVKTSFDVGLTESQIDLALSPLEY